MRKTPTPGRQVRRLTDARGFTLVELLIVILIIGILAAIALPAFLNQREKAQDTEAKTALRTAQTAIAVHHMDAESYAATEADLTAIEPTLNEARNLVVSGTVSTFSISEESATGTTFTVSRDALGVKLRDCDAPGEGLCSATADAGGNRW